MVNGEWSMVNGQWSMVNLFLLPRPLGRGYENKIKNQGFSPNYIWVKTQKEQYPILSRP